MLAFIVRLLELAAKAIVLGLVAAIILVLCSGHARAAEPVWGVHTFSLHVPAKDYQNNTNLGAYYRDPSGATAGCYRNTLRRTACYAGYTLEHGDFAVTVGGITGYKLRTEQVAAQSNGLCSDGLRPPCTARRGYSRWAVAPMLAPSYGLPRMGPVRPRIAYVPGLGGTSNVLHLMMEY